LLTRIEAGGRTLPRIDRDPCDGFTVEVHDSSADDDAVAVVVDDEHRLAKFRCSESGT
jgi:hypothetical protein